MNQIIRQTETSFRFKDLPAPIRDLDDERLYPVIEEEEDVMGETANHFKQIQLLYSLLEQFFAARGDALVASNMIVYYEQGEPTRWLSPDVMVCFGVSKEPRRVYRTWHENGFPPVVFEVASEKTFRDDLTKKLYEYNRCGAAEYYLLDPERAYLPAPLIAYHRADGGELTHVEIADNRIFSPLLGLEIVDAGKFIRLFDVETQEFLLTLEEAAAGLELAESKLEETTAELQATANELEQTTAELQTAESKLEQAEQENARLQAELERLRALVENK